MCLVDKLSRVKMPAAIVSILLIFCTLCVDAQVRDRDERYALFVSQRNGAAELYLLDLVTKQVSQLTNTGRSHISPAISLENRQIAYAARTGSSYEIFRGEIGSAWRTYRPKIVGVNRLTVNPMDETSTSLTGDGGLLAFSSGKGIELMRSNGEGRQVVVPVTDDFGDFGPVISPDGTKIAFVSDRTGEFELWLYYRDTGALRQLTFGGAALGGLNWSADSRQIAFTTAATSSKLRGVAIADSAGGSFKVLSDSNDSNPSFSARGDRILFTSMRDGDPEIYMMNFNTGIVERLTRSMGLDDSAIFLPEATFPSRQNR